MPKVRQRAAARRDLVEQFVHLAQSAGFGTAERFLVEAQASFNLLAAEPTIGAPLVLEPVALAGLRKWRVSGFDAHLIFCLPRDDGVSIVRVLHAARDWWRVLGLQA